MSENHSPEHLQLIDQLCDQFEAEWREGARPALELFLFRVPPALQAKLLQELVALEVEFRLKAGEKPSLHEYQQRFPVHETTLGAAFASIPAEGTARETLPAPQEEDPWLTLTVIDGPLKGQLFSFRGHDAFLAGRSKQAHLQVPNDKYFSRIHFMIEMNPPVCRLTDMRSHGGTFVNGTRVESVDLHHGDVIKGGRTELLVSIPTQAATLPVAPGVVETEGPTMMPSAVTPTPGSSDTYLTSPPRTVPPLAPPPAPPVPVASVDIPTELAGYRIIRELGRGGMGVVYLAEDPQGGATVALKTIVPAVVSDRKAIARFVREADILRSLQHEHIVGCHKVGESEGRLFIAMEFVPGTDAAKLLKQKGGAIPVRDAVRILCQLLSALEYAHSKQLVHRDIKPGNILVADDGKKKSVKLADFGLARVYQESRLSGLTMQGDVGGTLAYMPPEQITSFRQVRPAADQYSAAATLYTLLCGRHVFDFQPGVPPLMTVLQEMPIPLRQRRPEIPEELATIIHKALAKEPADRYPDVGILRQQLLPFAR